MVMGIDILINLFSLSTATSAVLCTALRVVRSMLSTTGGDARQGLETLAATASALTWTSPPG